MMRESDKVKQVAGEPHRRWFWDDYFDLLVWQADEVITGFQLRYQTPDGGRVLTWQQGQRCLHQKIDEGDDEYTQVDMTRLLVRDGVFNHDTVREEFRQRCSNIDSAVAAVVLEHMREFAQTQRAN